MSLYQVYPVDANTPTALDVVAVHGLDPCDREEHAFDTWTKNGRLWLRDDLPLDFPLARVFIHKYRSHPPHADTKRRLVEEALQLLNLIDSRREEEEEQPPRPIIFIAHGLGGLLVKQCMVKASLDPNLLHLFKAVRGLIFFGVPHRGNKEKILFMKKVAKSVADRAAGHMGLSGNSESDFLDAITGGSSTLDTLTEQFRGLQAHCSIVSFYEGKPYGSFGVVVSQDSAKIGLHDEFTIRLDADHLNICRFDVTMDEQDRESYALVKKRLRKLYGDALGGCLDGKADWHAKPRPAPIVPRGNNLRSILALPAVPDASVAGGRLGFVLPQTSRV